MARGRYAHFPNHPAIWVALGGASGTLVRWMISSIVIPPIGLWIANLSGCFAFGLLMGLTRKQTLPDWVQPAIGTGFLGGFTSFSAAILLYTELGADHQMMTLIIFMLVMPVLCVLGTWAGCRFVDIAPEVAK